jgi:hypothetical protein
MTTQQHKTHPNEQAQGRTKLYRFINKILAQSIPNKETETSKPKTTRVVSEKKLETYSITPKETNPVVHKVKLSHVFSFSS